MKPRYTRKAQPTSSYHRSAVQSILTMRDDPDMDAQTFDSICRSRGVKPEELRELIEAEKARRDAARRVA
jgi:hypothetical protein